jgi:hypothetical protein
VSERDITDQRFSEGEALKYLRQHFPCYDVEAPAAPGGQWRATAKFGQRDQLLEWTATELLEEMRHLHAARGSGRS